MSAAWTPSSWQKKPALQMAEWADKELSAKVLAKLSELPPLVHAGEVERLKTLMAEAGRGERFIVQGGDCAERFVDCQGDRLQAQLKMMLQLGLIVESTTGTPGVCICRIAGQYGKPRSKPTEIVDGHGEIMSFKGDNINGLDPKDRKWDPERLLQGYFHSAATLNFLRSQASEIDPAELTKVDVEGLKVTQLGKSSASSQFFTSHEAMQLDLEEALTRQVGDKYYNLGTHLAWIGDRTRQIDGAHLEYFRGISNPIGVKVGPSMKGPELQELVKILNPRKEEGRLMLITRYGAGKVEKMLTEHIKAVQETGVPVTWQCDAMHGNGIVAESNKLKTRRVESVIAEIRECIEVHQKCGSILGGIHLEATAQDVTECLGGSIGLTEKMLERNYETSCDPRLNYSQSVEVALTVAKELPSTGPPMKKARTGGARQPLDALRGGA